MRVRTSIEKLISIIINWYSWWIQCYTRDEYDFIINDNPHPHYHLFYTMVHHHYGGAN